MSFLASRGIERIYIIMTSYTEQPVRKESKSDVVRVYGFSRLLAIIYVVDYY